MRSRAFIVLLALAIAGGMLAVPAGATSPEREQNRSARVELEEAAHAHGHSHVTTGDVSGGRARPGVTDNFTILDHVVLPGRQDPADVYFFDHGFRGKFAYVGSFRNACTSDGVRIIDVTRPRRARLAAIAPLPDRWNTSTEDMVVARVGSRRILAGGLQGCGEHGRDGLALWDVTRPDRPRFLKLVRTPAGVHELDVTKRIDGTVLALLATPFSEFADTYFGTNFGGEFRIVDITDPEQPQRLSNWGIIQDASLVTFGGDEIVSSFQGMDSSFAAIYAHSVRGADDGTTAYVSYWDAGVLKLDISDPTAPALVGRTFYEVGDSGDAHSMFPIDVSGTRYIIQNDEDYFPGSPVTVTSSATGATPFNGMDEPWMPQSLTGSLGLTGEVLDAGDGCQGSDFAGASGKVALVDTVDPFYVDLIPGWTAPCSLTTQVRRAANNGATAMLSSLVSPDDPYPFGGPPRTLATDEDMVVVQVAAADGLADALRAAAPTPTVTLTPSTPAVGYVRIFDESQVVDSDGDGISQEFAEVATFTEPPHVFDDPTLRRGLFSVHNTEVNGQVAYSSWYSHGIVAWDLSTITAPVQVGQFRPPTRRGWPLVWGVAIDPETGIVYASDMVGGLWIARPTGPAAP